MVDAFFFVGLPYTALAVLVVVSIYRFKSNRFSYSALSSQFLENRWLLWGSMPWHVGILIVFLGHLIPFLLPDVWQALTANRYFLFGVECLGFTAGILCVIGLGALLVRRVLNPRVQSVTTPTDIAVLLLLICQVVLGLSVAASHRWGAVWSTHTTTPYLWSLLTFQPNAALISELPPVMRVHLVMAWVLFLLVPFSRLVHVFSLPLAYLWRAPQRVVWTNGRRFAMAAVATEAPEEDRRYFLRGAAGAGAAGLLLSVGVLDQLARFFRGPQMTAEEEADLLNKKLQRLELTAQERELEIERMKNEYIYVARLTELSPKDGHYFTDYQMRPALAFRDGSGLPLLISAKCTHLGCTVASTLNESGQLLCPCHISYFDIKSGAPNPGSPAKAPLPHIGWALMDTQGKLVATQGPDGRLEGEPDLNALDTYTVHIAKQFEEIA
jgi:nitrate reductase gamma subunit